MNIIVWWAAIIGLLILSIPLSWVVSGLRGVVYRARLRAQRITIAEYTPPHGLAPEQLGFLTDGVFGTNELLAVIVVLYRQGLIELAFKNGSIVVTGHKKRHHARLSSVQMSVLGIINHSKERSLTWDDLNTFVSRTIGVHDTCHNALLADMTKAGYLSERNSLNMMQVSRNIILVLSFLVAVLFFGVPLWVWSAQNQFNNSDGYVQIDNFVLLLAFVPVIGLGWWLFNYAFRLLAWLIRRGNGIPSGATDKLSAAWHDIVGYRNFLRVVEFDRLRVNPDINDPVLPWCIALGFRADFEKLLTGG